MKKIALVSSAFLLLLLSACDKVKNPIVPKNTVKGTNFITNSNKTVSNQKKVLLEDFTGQRCQNCPTAARIITNDLLPVYSSSLIVIAAHQGNTYARPFGTFTNDFRTEAGEEWGGSSGFGSFNEYPTGLINRKAFSGTVKQGYSNWVGVVPVALKDPFILKLDLKTEYDPTVRALNVYVKGTFKLAYTNKTNLIAVFLQDSIIGKQTDGSVDKDDYEFEHMLRGDINGIWGVEFSSKAALPGDTVVWSKIGFPLPKYTIKGEAGQPINDKKVAVVVFAYDATTREVLQAEKVEISKQEISTGVGSSRLD